MFKKYKRFFIAVAWMLIWMFIVYFLIVFTNDINKLNNVKQTTFIKTSDSLLYNKKVLYLQTTIDSLVKEINNRDLIINDLGHQIHIKDSINDNIITYKDHDPEYLLFKDYISYDTSKLFTKSNLNVLIKYYELARANKIFCDYQNLYLQIELREQYLKKGSR